MRGQNCWPAGQIPSFTQRHTKKKKKKLHGHNYQMKHLIDTTQAWPRSSLLQNCISHWLNNTVIITLISSVSTSLFSLGLFKVSPAKVVTNNSAGDLVSFTCSVLYCQQFRVTENIRNGAHHSWGGGVVFLGGRPSLLILKGEHDQDGAHCSLCISQLNILGTSTTN